MLFMLVMLPSYCCTFVVSSLLSSYWGCLMPLLGLRGGFLFLRLPDCILLIWPWDDFVYSDGGLMRFSISILLVGGTKRFGYFLIVFRWSLPKALKNNLIRSVTSFMVILFCIIPDRSSASWRRSSSFVKKVMDWSLTSFLTGYAD